MLGDMQGETMANVHLTKSMEEYVQGQIQSGAYADVDEVVQAGLRLLMEHDGARQFFAMKNELEEAVKAAEKGEFSDFDPKMYEPNAFTA